MADKYWALVDLRYPAGDDDYAKAVKQKEDGSWPISGEDYKEISVKAGELLVSAPEKTIKAYLSTGREVITTKAPEPAVKAEKMKAVKA